MRRASLGLFRSWIVVAILAGAGSRAWAQADPPEAGFGDKGHLVLGAERMFGYVHASQKRPQIDDDLQFDLGAGKPDRQRRQRLLVPARRVRRVHRAFDLPRRVPHLFSRFVDQHRLRLGERLPGRAPPWFCRPVGSHGLDLASRRNHLRQLVDRTGAAGLHSRPTSWPPPSSYRWSWRLAPQALLADRSDPRSRRVWIHARSTKRSCRRRQRQPRHQGDRHRPSGSFSFYF